MFEIQMKQVEKRKYSKSFEKIKQKGIKKITEKEFQETFKDVLDDMGLDRKTMLLIKDRIILNNDSDEVDYFEILDDVKDIKDAKNLVIM